LTACARDGQLRAVRRLPFMTNSGVTSVSSGSIGFAHDRVDALLTFAKPPQSGNHPKSTFQ
jgi:hypothetical protein